MTTANGQTPAPFMQDAPAVISTLGTDAHQGLTSEQAAGFYAEHQGKPFYDGLVGFMTSGPVMVQVLEGEDAIRRHREIMGATNPKEALAGTLRACYAESIDRNAVHGSDAPASAAREIAYFFSDDEICPRG